jgi:hypothetical protein
MLIPITLPGLSAVKWRVPRMNSAGRAALINWKNDPASPQITGFLLSGGLLQKFIMIPRLKFPATGRCFIFFNQFFAQNVEKSGECAFLLPPKRFFLV